MDLITSRAVMRRDAHQGQVWQGAVDLGD